MARPHQRQKRASEAAVATASDTPARSTRRPATPEPKSQEPDPEPSDDNDTIGSRLRKKRRLNASSPFDEGSPARKRRTPNKDMTPSTKKAAQQQASKPETPARVKEVKIQSEGVETRRSTRRRQATEKAASPVATEVSNLANGDGVSDTPPGLRESRRKSRRSISRHTPAIESTPPQATEKRKQSKRDRTEVETLQLDMDVVGRIIEHCEEIAQIYHYRRVYGNGVETDGLPTMGARQDLKKDALPVLNELCIQILSLFATLPYSEITELVVSHDSERGKAYAGMKKLFDNTKKVYPSKDHLISTSELGSLGQGAINIARKANLATYITSCFGSGDIGFFHLDKYFLDTFASDGNRLLKQQANLWLSLKTMAYFGAMSSDGNKEDVLSDMFPVDLEAKLLARRPGAKSLASSEGEFLQRANERHKLLASADEAELDKLQDVMSWDDFLMDLAGYLQKNFEMIVEAPPAKFKPLDENGLRLEPNLDFSQTRRQRSVSLAEDGPYGVFEEKDMNTKDTEHSSTSSETRIVRELTAVEAEFVRRRELAEQGERERLKPRNIDGAASESTELYQGRQRDQPPSPRTHHPTSEASRPPSQARASQPPQHPPHYAGHWAPPPPGYWAPFPPQFPPGGPHPNSNGHPQQPEHGPPPPFYGYPPPPPGYMYGPPVPQGSQPQHAAYAPPYPGPPHMAPPPWPGQGPPPGPYYHHPQTFHPHQPGMPPPSPNQAHPQQSEPAGQGPYPPPTNAPYFQQNQHYYQSPFPVRREDLPPPVGGMFHQMGVPSPYQSAPTSVLYERARAVANSKNNSAARNRPSNVSQRRPWTTEEETALMQGLDIARGPHWSSILAMYGPNGSISEALKGRNQVQLKDKARNLKLFFLKNQIEVPYFLAFVTGDLKRASGPPGRPDGEYGDAPNGDGLHRAQSPWEDDGPPELPNGEPVNGEEDQDQGPADEAPPVPSTPSTSHRPLPYNPTQDSTPMSATERRDPQAATPGTRPREAPSHYISHDPRAAPPAYVPTHAGPPPPGPGPGPGPGPYGMPLPPPPSSHHRTGSGYEQVYPPPPQHYVSPFGPPQPPPQGSHLHQQPPPPTHQQIPSGAPPATTGTEFKFRPAFYHFKPPPHQSHEHFARLAKEETERAEKEQAERAAREPPVVSPVTARPPAAATSPTKPIDSSSSPQSATTSHAPGPGPKQTEFKFKHWTDQQARKARGHAGSIGSVGDEGRPDTANARPEERGKRPESRSGPNGTAADTEGSSAMRPREEEHANVILREDLNGHMDVVRPVEPPAARISSTKRRHDQVGQDKERDGDEERPSSRHKMVSGWATVNR